MATPAVDGAEQASRTDLLVLRCAHLAAEGAAQADYEMVRDLLVYQGLAQDRAEQAIDEAIAYGLLAGLLLPRG